VHVVAAVDDDGLFENHFLLKVMKK
jgi:hypothetical protein